MFFQSETCASMCCFTYVFLTQTSQHVCWAKVGLFLSLGGFAPSWESYAGFSLLPTTFFTFPVLKILDEVYVIIWLMASSVRGVASLG